MTDARYPRLADTIAKRKAVEATLPPPEVMEELNALARKVKPGDRDTVSEYMRAAVLAFGAARGWDLTVAMSGRAPGESTDDYMRWLRSEFPIAPGAKVLL